MRARSSLDFDPRLFPRRRRLAWGRLAAVMLGAVLAAWWVG